MNYIEALIFENKYNEQIEHTEFIDCEFKDIDFSDKNFNHSKFIDCRFVHCNLSNIKLTNTVIRDTFFESCKILGVNWNAAQNISDLSIENSILNLSVMQDLNLTGAKFKNSQIVDVDFSGSKLQRADFSGSKLKGSNFNECDLTEANFTAAEDYHIDVRYSIVKRAKFSLPEAIMLLKSLEVEIN